MNTEEQFTKIVEKVQQLKASGQVDLSLEEDLSIAVMNLVSLEEHCYFTGIKTGKEEYFDLLNEIRAVRKDLLARMIDTHEGETWCLSKHLLAATMRMVEVGTKYLADGKKDEAQKLFAHGSKIYSIFWALRLKLIKPDGVKRIRADQLNVHDKQGTGQPLAGQAWDFEDIMKKLVDCCNESR